MTQCRAEALQWTLCHNVVDPHVGFPFVGIRPAAIDGPGVHTPKVTDGGLQARRTHAREIIGVLAEGGGLTGTTKVADHGIGEGIERSAALAFVTASAVSDVRLV